MPKKRRLHNEINVVPYIDVMLVLLVIFMVTAPMMNTAKVDLPSVAQTPESNEFPFEIIIREDETLSLIDRTQSEKETPFLLKDLVLFLQNAQAEKPRAVVIAGDKNVKYQAILSVMEALQNARIQKVGLLVRTR